MEKLAWYFELIDKVSGPARRVETALQKIKRSLGGGGGLSKVLDGAATSFTGMREGLSQVTAGLGGMAGMIAGVVGVGAVGGLAAAGAKWAIDSVNFRESTMVAFKTMLGTQEAAKEMMDRAVKFAAKTPFATNEVIEMTKRLLVAGFKSAELEPMMLGLGDVGFLLDKEKMGGLMTAFAKLRSQGHLTAETLETLAVNGVRSDKLFEALGGQLGVTAEQAHKMMTAGKITGDMPIVAALEVIRTQLSGGKLGAGMASAAGSLSGLWSTLVSKPEELMLAFSDMEGAGDPLSKIKSIIIDLTATLDPSGPTGKRILGLFAMISSAMDRMLGSVMKGRSMESVLEGVLNVLEPILKIALGFGEGMFAGFMAGMKPLMDVVMQISDAPGGVAAFTKDMFALGEVVGRVAAVMVYGVGALLGLASASAAAAGWFYGGIVDLLKQIDLGNIIGTFLTLGVRIVEGLWAGITQGWGAMLTKFAGLVDLLPASVRAVLGIQSPSRVMEQLGAYTGQGFALGLDRSGMNDTIAVPTAGAGGMAGGSRIDMGGISVVVQVSGSKDAAAIGSEVADAIEEKLASMFGQLALAGGI